MRSPQGIEALLEQLKTGPLAGAPESDPEVFGRPSRAVSCGWPSVDGAMGSASGAAGLARGCIHEWLGVGVDAGHRGVGSADTDRSPREWSPPLLLLAHLARNAVLDAIARGAPASVVWIGRRAWPYAGAVARDARVVETREDPGPSRTAGELEVQLGPEDNQLESRSAKGGELLERSIFAAPKDASLRLWAIDTALRCPGVTAVIADGSGLGMAATRRLQLAATSSEALVLLARPPGEEREVSAATTRWRVTRYAGEPTQELGLHRRGARGHEDHSQSVRDGPTWSATLLRAKGAQRLRRSPLDAPLAAHEPRRGAG